MNENENQTASPPGMETGATTDEVPGTPVFEPMPDSPGIVTTFETLLKRPVSLVDAVLGSGDSRKIVSNLMLTSVACLAVFGLVVGTYSMGSQVWAAPLKITLGMLVAGLICLPSLYIFSCLNGLDVKLSSAAGVLFATICMTALLLLGFTPVVWIFSQSTNSIAFMGALALVFWSISTYFGFGVILRTAEFLGMKRRSHLLVWMGIFVLVCLQMTTSLRPIVGKSDQFLTSEKKFFLTHWSEQIETEARQKSVRARSASASAEQSADHQPESP